MKPFEDLFKDLSEMEGTPLEELIIATDKFFPANISLRSEGEIVYELNSATENSDKNNYYEVLYHMMRTKDGRLLPVSSLQNDLLNNFSDLATRSKLMIYETIFQKIRMVYDIIKDEGVLKNSDPNSISSQMWGDNGLAVKFLEPRSKESRFFYTQDGKISKVIDKNAIGEYFYSQRTGKIDKYRNIRFEEGRNGLEESSLFEKTYDEDGRVLTTTNRIALKDQSKYSDILGTIRDRIETVTTNYYFNNNSGQLLRIVNDLIQSEPVCIRDMIHVDKETGFETIVSTDSYRISRSNLFNGKFSVTVISNKDTDEITHERSITVFDNISRLDISRLMNELSSMYFDRDNNDILNNADIFHGDWTKVKKEHYEFKDKNISIDLSFINYGWDKDESWRLNTAVIEHCTEDIKMTFYLSLNSDSKLGGNLLISAKTVIDIFPEYLKSFIKSLKMVIDENPMELAYLYSLYDYECTENDIFGIEFSSIELDIDCSSLANVDSSKSISYSFAATAPNRFEKDGYCIAKIKTEREHEDGEIVTILSFPQATTSVDEDSWHDLELFMDTKNITGSIKRKIISDKNYSDILEKYVGKDTTEEIKQWQLQLKKLMKPTKESLNGSTTHQKIIPMSRSENGLL